MSLLQFEADIALSLEERHSVGLAYLDAITKTTNGFLGALEESGDLERGARTGKLA